MLQDESHRENVTIMLAACKVTGTALFDVSTVISNDWIKNAAKKLQEINNGPTELIVNELNFASGYLQATSNILKISWKDQLTAVAEEEDPVALDADGFAEDVGASLVRTDAIVTAISAELEVFRQSQIQDAIKLATERQTKCEATGALFESYLYSLAVKRLEAAAENQ